MLSTTMTLLALLHHNLPPGQGNKRQGGWGWNQQAAPNTRSTRAYLEEGAK